MSSVWIYWHWNAVYCIHVTFSYYRSSSNFLRPLQIAHPQVSSYDAFFLWAASNHTPLPRRLCTIHEPNVIWAQSPISTSHQFGENFQHEKISHGTLQSSPGGHGYVYRSHISVGTQSRMGGSWAEAQALAKVHAGKEIRKLWADAQTYFGARERQKTWKMNYESDIDKTLKTIAQENLSDTKDGSLWLQCASWRGYEASAPKQPAVLIQRNSPWKSGSTTCRHVPRFSACIQQTVCVLCKHMLSGIN